MVYKVLLTPQARDDLRDIGHHIAQDNPLAAERFIQKLLDAALSLRQSPLQGKTLKRKPGVRRIIQGNYFVYYRIEKQSAVVWILRFWHAARHPKTPHFD